MASLESLYLDPAQAGVPWLLDPDNPEVLDGLRAASTRKPTDPCDPAALIAGIPDVLRLLRERHFGLATGIVNDDGLDGWADKWRHRLEQQHPTTWGQALGTDIYQLRRLLGDAHAGVRGEDPDTLSAANPRYAEPVLDDNDGPIVEEHVTDGVLTLRIRRFFGNRDDEQTLAGWRDAHERHFSHERIVLDLRGNSGGNEEYCRDWVSAHLPAATQCGPPNSVWRINGRGLGYWNESVRLIAVHGPQAAPPRLLELRPQPRPGATLGVEIDSGDWLPAGPTPWWGRMLVITDRGTVSSAEGTAWMFRAGLGARLVGRPSHGALRFGDIAPYLLPRSGLMLRLGTFHTGYPDGIELTGIPVDVELDPRTPLAEIAADFDRISASAQS